MGDPISITVRIGTSPSITSESPTFSASALVVVLSVIRSLPTLLQAESKEPGPVISHARL